MKKWLVKVLIRRKWWGLAYRISPSITGYYAGALYRDGVLQGLQFYQPEKWRPLMESKPAGLREEAKNE